MLQNVLDLPASSSVASFEENLTVPAWAQNALTTLSTAGVPVAGSGAMEPVTRRDAANLLYASNKLLPEEPVAKMSVFSWIKEKIASIF